MQALLGSQEATLRGVPCSIGIPKTALAQLRPYWLIAGRDDDLGCPQRSRAGGQVGAKHELQGFSRVCEGIVLAREGYASFLAAQQGPQKLLTQQGAECHLQPLWSLSISLGVESCSYFKQFMQLRCFPETLRSTAGRTLFHV